MDAILNRMRQESLRANRRTAEPRIGVITSFDPATHRAKVKIMPEGAQGSGMPETDWLPIATSMVGASWGVYASPSPGEQVLVVHQEGDHGSGVIVGRINSAAHPPLAVPSGEVWMIHQTGSGVQLFNTGELLIHHHGGSKVQFAEDGTLLVQHQSGSSMTMGSDGKVVIHGDVIVEGNVNVTGDISDNIGSLAGLRGNYNGHVHTGVQNGGGSTGNTTQPDPG